MGTLMAVGCASVEASYAVFVGAAAGSSTSNR